MQFEFMLEIQLIIIAVMLRISGLIWNKTQKYDAPENSPPAD